MENKRQDVTVVDLDMPFGSMVMFMVKVALASIPAAIILWLIGLGVLLIYAELSRY